mmetsp:Transcript_11189/g.21316  ORF Transcript_11189/g.21316 Transcript_11189/m.21316 type:complete len:800 (+) Transcript_11189:91-2490(+)
MTDRQQGVLWKRRDVFKMRWRPRWFVLHPEQGVLTYYLLTANVSEGLSSPSARPALRGGHTTNSRETPRATESSSRLLRQVDPSPRIRTFSMDSQVSENTVDYDVVPRGTLDLRGCQVEPNEKLSKAADHFFAFTIKAPQSSTASEIHLAARTPQSRRVWIERIQRVMGRHNNAGNSNAYRTNQEEQEGGISEFASFSNRRITERLPEVENEDELSSMPDNNNGMTWKQVGLDSVVYENLTPALMEQIQNKIQTFLPVIDETPGSTGWHQLFERGDHSAYQKEIPLSDSKSLTIIKSIAFLDHPPRQLLNLLLDSTRRGEFETNLKSEERLTRLNDYTVLDYYSYEPVWPTSSREFAVATHWHVVQKGGSNERALIILAFSCLEADRLRPLVEAKHVRADLIISMSLLRPVGESQCHYTRILCFDPKVGFSQRLGSYITAQQAGQPAVLSQYLQQHEPIPSSRMHGPLEEDAIIRDIVHHLPDGAIHPRRLNFNRNSSGPGDDDNSQLATTIKTEVPGPPPLETQATYLLAPTLIYRILDSLEVSGSMILFVVLAFLAVRQVVLLHLGEILSENSDSPVVGPVTCKFTVDLKGAMRFVNNKKEEREELCQGTAEVSIVHLVASAVARALKETPSLHRRRVIMPWLWIDKVVDASNEPISVSISENSSGWVTLDNVDRVGVQTLSDAALEAERVLDATERVGQCLVVAPPPVDASPGRFASQIEIHAAPLLQAGVLVVAVLGNVRMEKGPKKSSSPIRPPRSVIDVFLTMKSPSEGDFATCRRYAEEVQKLLQFPEMCDM